tara:strand:+ start:862 stop:969 length:108 start_codon:yes stop_codon:yes gene_type:complete
MYYHTGFKKYYKLDKEALLAYEVKPKKRGRKRGKK